MSVITISNERGSQGSLIAETVARTLGYHLANQTLVETMLKDYGLVEFHEEYRSIPGFWDRLDADKQERRDTFLSMLNKSLLALARHGNVVIVSRGGFAVLAGLADVLNVRIQAPLGLRIERTEEVPTLVAPNPEEAAGVIVKDYDQLQKTFVESVYGIPWDTSKSFDLVIDTGKIAPDLASSLIVQAVKALKAPLPKGAAIAADLEVDKVLASSVQAALKCEVGHAG
jgi:cytidylate kinase